MRLRSITLSGFKTFAKKTEVAFGDGVTAIVGPNGSGKSNTVDAFRWVLGESQAKDLRGRRMEEVIYAGGEKRARAAEAEVTLLIDNSDGRIPVEYREVEIRRRADRAGAGQYYLNGSRIRRRDLMRLLTSTGLTTDGYAMVDQRDIDSIVNRSPEQRRQLIEEAAQVRGVKARRSEAALRLQELAQNLVRLKDVRQEIEPRLAALRLQAEAASEAALVRRRLEVLRGSIAVEEWRQARDERRRLLSVSQGLERRLEQAKLAALSALAAHEQARLQLEGAQRGRLKREAELGARRLEVSAAEHALGLTAERLASKTRLLESLRAEEEGLLRRQGELASLRSDLESELQSSLAAARQVEHPGPPPDPVDQSATRAAEGAAARARERVQKSLSRISGLRARAHYLEGELSRVEPLVAEGRAGLAAAETRLAQARGRAASCRAAADRQRRLEVELEGLLRLSQTKRPGQRRLGEVVTAKPGYEAALSSALGSLLDAVVCRDAEGAERIANPDGEQLSVVFPVAAEQPEPGSLYHLVEVEEGYRVLAAGLLGSIVLGRDVDARGVFRRPGLVRAGLDPRVVAASRRRQVSLELESVRQDAGGLGQAEADLKQAEAHLHRLQAAASQAQRLEIWRQEREGVGAELVALEADLAGQEEAAAQATVAFLDLRRLADQHLARVAEHRERLARAERERARWAEAADKLRRRLAGGEEEAGRIASGLDRCRREASARAAEIAELDTSLPALEARLDGARGELAQALEVVPEGEARIAEAAKALVAAEEGRVHSALQVSTLEGQVERVRAEASAAAEEETQARQRMPEGLAPDEVPGGKAREREMRQLERRLEEIGKVNDLALAELAELEARYQNLLQQLDDIDLARADLEGLIVKLRQEEDQRYDSVFGAVAAGFMEYFSELSGGGAATLRQIPAEDGSGPGVEVMVRPPRKRLQNVTLLSSGEKALTAISLVLALEAVNPAPFMILDEVDAALDDANVVRFAEMLRRLGEARQVLVITHNHRTMAAASALFGVHLDPDGASRMVSVKLEEAQIASTAGRQSA